MKRATREWVRKAEAGYRLAAKLGRGSEPFQDQLCFPCQQSSEKYLKALLEELGHSIPHTHALGDLLALVLPSHTSLRPLQRGMNYRTRFAVGIRYPGDNATKR